MTLNSVNKLNNSTLCLLFGINSRYEGSYLNLKLRQRHLKGNFKIISVGSSVDLTIPISYSGLNIKKLKALAEGNSFLCQEISNSVNPIIILGSEIYKRKDSLGISAILEFLKSKNKFIDYSNLNLLSSSINEVGINYIQGFKSVTSEDLGNSSGIYFLNANVNKSLNINKILNLKILKNYNLHEKNPFFLYRSESRYGYGNS